jgi:hypothetical protein
MDSLALFFLGSSVYFSGHILIMKKISLTVTALLFYLFTFAQETGYLPGAIITLDNERIPGLVKNFNLVPARVLDNIKFKREEGAKVEVYSPDELSGYESDGVLYVPKRLASGTKSFVRKFNTGKLQLYGLLILSGPSYQAGYVPYIQMGDEPTIHEVIDIGFRKHMLRVLKDAPELCKLIESRTLKRKDMEEIVRLYNDEISRSGK